MMLYSARLEALTKLLEPTLQPELQQRLLTSGEPQQQEQEQEQQQQQQQPFGQVAVEGMAQHERSIVYGIHPIR